MQGKGNMYKRVQGGGNKMGNAGSSGRVNSGGASTSGVKNDKGESISQKSGPKGEHVKSSTGIRKGGVGNVVKQEYRVKSQGAGNAKKGGISGENIVKVENRFEVLGKENMGGGEMKEEIGGMNKGNVQSKVINVDKGKNVVNDVNMQERVLKTINIGGNENVVQGKNDSLDGKIETKVNTKSGYFKMNEEQFNEVAHYVLNKICPANDTMLKWNIGQKKLFFEQWDKLMFQKVVDSCEVESEGDEMAVAMKDDGTVLLMGCSCLE
ncbi:hypothetical protein HanIR_Chr07g0309641 [Helianthus annuus]|nr:hypothetical protein HanIR_Chr07g0309641 [Helianthus annuus]